jgi:hypothetical protein
MKKSILIVLYILFVNGIVCSQVHTEVIRQRTYGGSLAEIHLNDEKKASFDFSATPQPLCYVFPNPASDYINIAWENIDEQTKAFVEIFCITGTKVLSLHMNTILQGNTVNVSSLQSGHYLYRITLPEVVFNGSFVIIR